MNTIRRNILCGFLLALLLVLPVGCSDIKEYSGKLIDDAGKEITSRLEDGISDIKEDISSEIEEGISDIKSDISSELSEIPDISDVKNDILSEIPGYGQKPYVELDDNKPNFTKKQKKNKRAFEKYSKLDRLGRCGPAFVNVCPEIQPKKKRGKIGHIRPSGWHTIKYNDLIDGNYLYNRCHLVGYQLSGENANAKNLITGTRYLNVEGMLPFENEVDDYVERTGNHVLYRVTPVFEDDNLVAEGVQMEAWSVEDKGKGVCFNVFCYNIQPGIIIDYSTGESRRE